MNWIGGSWNRVRKRDKQNQKQFFASMRLAKHMAGNNNHSAVKTNIPTPAEIFFASKMGTPLPLKSIGSFGNASSARDSRVTRENSQLPSKAMKKPDVIPPNYDPNRQSLASTSGQGYPDPLAKWCEDLEKDFDSKSIYAREEEKPKVFSKRRPQFSSQNQKLNEYAETKQPKKHLGQGLVNYRDEFENTKPESMFSLKHHNEFQSSILPFSSGDHKDYSELSHGFWEIEENRESVMVYSEHSSESPFIKKFGEPRSEKPTCKFLTPPLSTSSGRGFQLHRPKIEKTHFSLLQLDNKTFSTPSRSRKKMQTQNSETSQNINEGYKTPARKVQIVKTQSSRCLNERGKIQQRKDTKASVIDLKADYDAEYQEWLMSKIMDELLFELPIKPSQSSLESRESFWDLSSCEEDTQKSTCEESNSSLDNSKNINISGVSSNYEMDIVKVRTKETSTQTVDLLKSINEDSVQVTFESPKTKKDFVEAGIQYNEFDMASYFYPHKRLWHSV